MPESDTPQTDQDILDTEGDPTLQVIDTWSDENSATLSAIKKGVNSEQFKSITKDHGVDLTPALIQRTLSVWEQTTKRWESKQSDLLAPPEETERWLKLTELGSVIANYNEPKSYSPRHRPVMDYLNVVYALDMVAKSTQVIDPILHPPGSFMRAVVTDPFQYFDVSIRSGAIFTGDQTLEPTIEIKPGPHAEQLREAINQFADTYYKQHGLNFTRGDAVAP